MATIHFITGGQRSGKSNYAQQLALSMTKKPVYLATARVWDEDFQQRIDRHKAERGKEWINMEVPENIGDIEVCGQVVVLDCITLWLTNLFFKQEGATVEAILDEAKRLFDKMLKNDATFLVVSNEIGLGGHAEQAIARRFADLQGWMNQYIAQQSDKVTLMISGIAVPIKV